MISALTYGHSGFTSSAYYFFGISGSFQKFANGGAVEAGWLDGFVANPTTPSNLGPRPVNLYNQVTNVNRFAFYTGGLVLITARAIPQFDGGNPGLSPATVSWKQVV